MSAISLAFALPARLSPACQAGFAAEKTCSELTKALKLPAYFGENWDALEECLRDRSWLGKGEQVVLLHEHVPLSDSRQRQTYVQILRNAQSASGGLLRIVFPLDARDHLS